MHAQYKYMATMPKALHPPTHTHMHTHTCATQHMHAQYKYMATMPKALHPWPPEQQQERHRYIHTCSCRYIHTCI